MTDTEINIAIAEACGWKIVSHSEDKDGKMSIPLWAILDPTGALFAAPPNYAHDLNAMHEAEGSIVEPYDIEKYVEQLYVVLERFWTPDRWVKFSCLGIDYAFAHATAHQRAEAFLRTLGKWQ